MLRIALPNPIILIPMQSKFLLSRGLSGPRSRLMLTNAPRSQPWVLLHSQAAHNGAHRIREISMLYRKIRPSRAGAEGLSFK